MTAKDNPFYVTDQGVLLEIQRLLSGKEWDSDTLTQVAEIMEQAGYEIQAYDPGEEQQGSSEDEHRYTTDPDNV